MKKLLLLTTLISLPLLAYAQSVSYTYKPLSTDGCYVTYNVAKQDSSNYIVVTIKSERFKFLSESTMLIKTYNDEIIKLEGKHVKDGSETAGLIYGGIFIPVTEINTTAQFKITDEQIEKLKDGVAKIRITAIPKSHERTFKKDKIGKKLYKYFNELVSAEESF